MAENQLAQYGELLHKLKEKIKVAQMKVIHAINNELLSVYWEIGNAISSQEKAVGWGGKIVDTLAADLKAEFPQMKGLSPRNIRYLRDFAIAYPFFKNKDIKNSEYIENKDVIILQQLAAKLPWGHHQLLLTKLKSADERAFYIKKTVQNGWSRSVLEYQIEIGLFKSQGALVNNFNTTIPSYECDLTTQIFKDPYNFDFIMLNEKAKERDLENALMTHVTKVLLELGAGFAFMGRQRKFEIGGKEFFFDLLFYHTKLRRHVIIELKIGEFEPEYIGKMNFYLSIADDQLKGVYDEAAIGLILCKTNHKVVAEYALRDITKPIGIAEYRITQQLPADFKDELPSIEDIEQRIDDEIKENQKSEEAKINTILDKLHNLNSGETI